MPSDVRSISFIFHREASNGVVGNKPGRRRRLFDKEESSEKIKSPENAWQNISLDSKRIMRNSAEKITKTLSTVKVKIDTFTQVMANMGAHVCKK